jgi:hypothetical protein
LYSSLNIIGVIKPRIIRWAGHVARIKDRRCEHTGFWWGDLKEVNPLENLGVEGRII